MDSRIEALATTIADSARTLRTLLAQHGLEEPSFAADCPWTPLPSALDKARNAVLDAACEIQDLLLDPADLLRSYASHAHLISLHFIQQFDIAQIVPATGPISFGEIARQCNGVPEADVRRLLRHAMTIRVFDEPVEGQVSHTRASMLLRTEGIDGWVGSTCENSWPASTKTVEALKRYPGSEEPSQSGFALANNGLALYEVIAQSPSRAATFAASKRGHASGAGLSPQTFVAAYHDMFTALRAGAVFVDIGGAHGHISFALADAYPHLRTLGDTGRVEFMEHDFFRTQPVRDAAVYYLRHILHNWGDRYAIKILKHLTPAMGAGSRVLIHEYCLEKPWEVPMWRRRLVSAMDIGMLQLLNARERDEQQWKALLREADARYQWIGVQRPEGSALAIIEVGWLDH
ncbi:hypothetical protein EYZ11_008383 [Aspergillus tanneri]|uniref:O-methyltransferase C-terminal domain-containing protein n=1 Tax=Aspergillus tanneri TaxID=1220188 RepID=A0A4S3JCS7_9EURO|nr:hypothetical protein EYZ11_008383 [Aspergillus tanneri]